VLVGLAGFAGVLVWTSLAGGSQPYETYEAVVAGDGPVAQFRFGDAVGSTTIADSAGGFTAANSGIVLGGGGPFGGSLSGSFGGEAYATPPGSPLAGASAFTMEGWVYWNGGTSYKQPIFDFGSSSSNYMYLTPASTLSGHVMLFEIHTTTGTIGRVTASRPMAKDWEYVAVTETSAGALTVYLNGAQVGQTTGVTVFPSSLGSTPNDWLGKSQVTTDPMFNGDLSNVAFYTKALSGEQVKAHFDAAEYPVNTVLPTITGSAKDGSTLTAHAGTWSGLTPITFAYQWTKCNGTGGECANITSATGTTYQAISADVGSTLRVAVTAHNAAGSGVATSAQTATVAPLAPSNTALPAISGTAKDGQLLSVSNGSWKGTTPLSYTYQWETCNTSGTGCAKITGATSASYRVLTSQIGKTLRAIVTATNVAGHANATSAATATIIAGPPVNTALPAITGTVQDEHALTASTGAWAGTAPITYHYQWLRCGAGGTECASIAGATGSTYTLAHADVASTIRVAVEASNAQGSATSSSEATAAVAATAPSNTALPVLSGTTQDGQLSSVSDGSWAGTPPIGYSYQWEVCNSSGGSCEAISGATAQSYRAVSSQIGHTLRATVKASNSAGNASATSAASAVIAAGPPVNTAIPAVSGTPQDGQTLTAGTGTWAGTPPFTYAYQWERCNGSGEGCVEIVGASSASYTAGHTDVGSTLRVKVTATNSAGSANATSAASAVVAALVPSNTVAPVVSGKAEVGQELTASNGEWAGTPPFTYGYQWESCNMLGEACLPIAGATSSGFTPGAGQAGDTLRVVVTATNSAGSASADSAVTAVVAGGVCTITWTGEAGGGLWQTPGNWSADRTPTVSDRVCIPAGATVHVSAGTNAAGSIAGGEGTLTITGGSLELASSSQTSLVGGFSLSGATLEGAGTLDVASSFHLGAEGVMSGSGATVVEPGVSGEVYASSGCEPMRLSAGRVFVNEGTLSFGWGTVFLSEGARFVNKGTFQDNSEASCYGTQVLPQSGGSAPALANTGTFEKTSGGGTSTVAVNFSNNGSVLAKSGTLDFSDGGIPEEVAFGTWATQGGAIVLSGGTFLIGSEVNLSAVEVRGATVTRVTPGPPSVETPPVVSGEPIEGLTLTATTGTWRGSPPLHYAYQWQRCNTFGGECANIEGATGSTYALGGGDVGHTVRVLVTATNTLGSAVESSQPTAVIATPTAPANTTPPAISGTAQDGQTLHAGTGVWTGAPAPTYAYQWQSCNAAGGGCSSIEGATTSSYALGHTDVGTTLRVTVEARNSAGSASSTSEASAVVAALVPSNTTPPAISGTAQAGQTLSAATGAWSGTPPLTYAYQWQSCNSFGEGCLSIPGATGASYVPGEGEVAGTLRVVVSATNSAGTASASSEATAVVLPAPPSNTVPPAISGTARSGQTLTAGSGSWTGAPTTYGYQWQSCNALGESCSDIPGATGPAYVAGEGDVGSTLRVRVTATNAGGSSTSGSEPTDVVEGASGEPVCTDTWIGPEEGGVWQEAADWSTGSVPGPLDVACAGSWVTIHLTEGAGQVGAVFAGGLVIAHGSLELTGASEASRVSALALEGGTLTGAGSVYVSGSLTWHEGTRVSGAGSLTLGPDATGAIEEPDGCNPLSLAGRALVNEGALTFGGGTLFMSAGAVIENRGTFVDNAESSECFHEEILPAPEAQAPVGILNIGTFEKTAGFTTSTVAVPFSDEGAVRALSGRLKFTDGGTSQIATGSWEVENGGSIALHGGTFVIGENVDLSAVSIEGSTTVTREPPVPPTSSSPPTVSGQPAAGQTLTASTGGWEGTPKIAYSYQWQSCNTGGAECSGITGASGLSYTLTSGQVGATVRVLVTATNAGGSASASSSPTPVIAAAVAPTNTAAPAISGSAQDGQTLTASTGTWTGTPPPTYSYLWESCNASGGGCAPIAYATGAQYKLSAGDAQTTVRVRVSATNAAGSAQASSPPSAVIAPEPPSELQAPSLSGVPDVHQVLTANPGAWAGTNIEIRYQWESCDPTGGECTGIEGATGPEYDLAESDLATTLRVRIGVHGAAGSITDVSPTTPPVGAAGALASSSPPTITGTLRSGQTLSASPGDWSENKGAVSYAYQWQTCDLVGQHCADIEGATSATYTPTAGNAGATLRVLVSASDERGSLSRPSPATQPVAASGAPTISAPPVISGTALEGQTLTATTGSWTGEGPIAYAYQWERCAASGQCTAIAGATASSYALAAGDVESTLRVLVSATGPSATSTGVSAATATIAGEPIARYSPPSISGVLRVASTLNADTGIWSATGATTVAYQWERCNATGAECAAIEGANEQGYVVSSEDLTSTLRVNVTLTTPHGASNALSAYTSRTPGGEVSAAQAQEVAEQTDPALLAPSTTATLDEQSIAPAIGETEEELTSQHTLTTSTISKETAGEFAVNTPVGELSLSPINGLPNTTATPTVVNGTAALYANTWPATDTIIRPDALGATTIQQIRSPEAPTTYSWEIHLGANQELRQLTDGSVAVINTPETPSEASAEHPANGPTTTNASGAGQPETTAEKAESEQEASEPEPEEEVPLEALPAAPQTTTPPAETIPPGQPEPQNTQAQYETDTTATAAAEAQTAGNTLMLIQPPRVTDAAGNALPASLSVTSDTITMTIKPSAHATYPLLAETTVAAPSDKTSEERDPVEYGLADERPESFSPLDPKLKTGPLHVRTARLFIPYDTLITEKTETTQNHEEKLRNREKLAHWLPAVEHEHLQPYITLTQDGTQTKGCAAEKTPCQMPSTEEYRAGVNKLIGAYMNQVTLWGAWNEPDLNGDPLAHHAKRAAQYWEVAQSVTAGLACSRCKIVAGEFAYAFKYLVHYTSTYRSTLFCRHHCGRRYWNGKPPSVWGFHDYHDVVHREKGIAQDFTAVTAKRTPKPQLWIGEAGVELQNNETSTKLEEEGSIASNLDAQAGGAEVFLGLHSVSPRIERIYYYQYTAPSGEEERNSKFPGHLFDSGLLTNTHGLRPAYCVIVSSSHACPPTVTTTKNGQIPALAGSCSQIQYARLRGTINPNGAETTFHFEYGPTTAYGSSTSLRGTVPSGWTPVEVEAIVPVTINREGPDKCGPALHYRLVAHNAASESQATGESQGADQEAGYSLPIFS